MDWSRTVLLWDSSDVDRFGLEPALAAARGIQTLKTSYGRIGRDPGLTREIERTRADAVIFTRNDDMPDAPAIGPFLGGLRKGYTAVSAIDPDEQEYQTRQCIEDLVRGHGVVALPRPIRTRPLDPGEGTFSLILDLEQFGGARFGMPRLLPLIESRGIRATFFVTGFIAETYPELIERIADGGHEIGVHGWMHDFLAGRPLEEQTDAVLSQARALGRYSEIVGANFIYRMDALSPEAILRAGLEYLVLFRKHLFYRSRFISASTRPRALRTAAGDVTAIPVPVETYNLQRPMLRAMMDSAWRRTRRDKINHISVLMHPFKDGTKARLATAEWVLDYLMGRLRLRSIPLKEVPSPIENEGESIPIAYRWDGYDPPRPPDAERRSRSLLWWSPMVYHARRTEDLADAFTAKGRQSALCAQVLEPATVYVYPDRPPCEAHAVAADPLINPERCARQVLRGRDRRTPSVVVPGSPFRDLLGFVWFHVPRTWDEVAFTLEKVWIRGKDLVRRILKRGAGN